MAYDKLKWSFLQQTLRMKGFSQKWYTWVEQFMQGRNVNIKVNDQLGSYFQTKKAYGRVTQCRRYYLI